MTIEFTILFLLGIAFLAGTLIYLNDLPIPPTDPSLPLHHQILEQLGRHDPDPAWILGLDKKVIWKNQTLESLPEAEKLQNFANTLEGAESGLLHFRAGQSFKVTSVPFSNGTLYFARHIAIEEQKSDDNAELLQTLGRSFADLPIGLAVFDEARHLVLFNPALTNLSGLSFEQLSSRPSLADFFDAMRGQGTLPEPKDYIRWRTQITEQEFSRDSAGYAESWALPGGLTYRVTGRPQKNGALALTIEDISQQILSETQQRAKIQIGLDFMDKFSEALAIFGQDGAMLASNKAYQKLWGVHWNAEPPTILDCNRYWQNQSRPSPIWAQILDPSFEIDPKNGQFFMQTGHKYHIRVSRLSQGARMVGFVPAGRESDPTRSTSQSEKLRLATADS